MTEMQIENTLKPRAPIEVRKATITKVNFPERIIELMAVPYDEWAMVEHPAGSGRFIEECFTPGCFGNVQNRASRFLVNREHDLDQVVGRCQALYPDRPNGMGADLFIRRGPEGDQTLQDAEDQMVGASVGFGALPENVTWEGRSRRRVNVAYLDHIGLTFTPAYTGTMPLAVRSRFQGEPQQPTSATPNLDRIMMERLAKQHGISYSPEQ